MYTTEYIIIVSLLYCWLGMNVVIRLDNSIIIQILRKRDWKNACMNVTVNITSGNHRGKGV